MKGICKICGKEFEKPCAHNMYCSDECRKIGCEKSAKKHIGETWQGMKIEDMFIRNGKLYAVLSCRVCGKKFSCRYDSLQRGQKSCGCDTAKPSSRSIVIGKKIREANPRSRSWFEKRVCVVFVQMRLWQFLLCDGKRFKL